MILGQVSWLDCIVFLVFLTPQLIAHAGFFRTLSCGLQALPFLLIKLPLSFIHDRYILDRAYRDPFVQHATWFEDITVRCVRYAFAYIPPDIGRVFLSQPVALPFLRFRMFRHGYLHSPIHWHEVKQNDFQGLWIIENQFQEPDVVIYYAHGGGFSMGSSYFYLEFFLAWLSLLKSSGFRNPAIFSLEYTLVPDKSYPVQLLQTIAGYKHVLSLSCDPARICVSGDSAGATLILSLLLYLESITMDTLANITDGKEIRDIRPGLAVLISPWVTLVSPKDKITSGDYLNPTTLHQYAHQYANKAIINSSLVSPGNCKNAERWKIASPAKGFFIHYGSEEVFAQEIRDWVVLLKSAGIAVESWEEKGGIHAWPVAALFLSSTRERQKGIKMISERIRKLMCSK